MVVPSRALSEEARASPIAQLLAGAALQAQSSGARASPLIQVPPSPLSSSTLQALQQSSQQFAVRDESIFTLAAEAPARELQRTLSSLRREVTVTTPATTTTSLVERPDRTITRTVTETTTVPGTESSGVQELRGVLDRAAARAGASEDRGNGRYSDRRIDQLSGFLERAGDRLLDSLESIVDRGGRRTEGRIERTLGGLGELVARTVDRLFDRGGERGVSAFDQLVEQNSQRIVSTFGRVLAATGDDVSRQLENLLVRAGPEAIEALQAAVDRVRPTTTQTTTREETEVIDGGFDTVTTTTPGSTVTVSNSETVEIPPTPTEARAEIRRQVTAYSNASNLLAPLQELASPPPAVPNPAAIVERPEPRSDRGPIVREATNDDDRRSRRDDDIRITPIERPEITGGPTSLAPPIRSTGETASPLGSLVEIAA
ncbi:MAG: hypothetical protein FJX54_09970 [Alphaproteobacteria bacterium]|nr:hypothetical protein [Alphaproteobacteria bacterium]